MSSGQRGAAEPRCRRDECFAPFDSLIAATVVVNRLPLFTQDAQFADMPGVDVHLM